MEEKVGFRGWRAAPFVFAVESFHSMVITTLGLNLYTYVIKRLHYPLTDASKVLTNFSGTAALLSLLGGFLSDAYISQSSTVLIGEVLGALGCAILTVFTVAPTFQPSRCPPTCTEPTAPQKAVFFTGLYVLAIGSAFIRPNNSALGAAQFDENDPRQKKQLLSYFNWYFFSTALGAFPAVTVISYTQEQVSEAWGFGIPAILLATSIVVICIGMPYRAKEHKGSVITLILQVFVAAFRNWNRVSSPEMLYEEATDKESAERSRRLPHTNQFRFLDKAAIRSDITDDAHSTSSWKLCPVTQIEEVKAVIRILPIFASTIMLSCVLAQLQTLTLSQAYTLERNITKNFQMPVASLAAFPLLSILILLPLYDRFLVPFLRGFTGNQRGINHLQRLGFGLFFCTLSMVVAALVETKRLAVVREHNLLDSPTTVLPMSAFWMVLQFLIFGMAETFSIVALLDFFYTESPHNMRTMGISLVNVSISFGYFLSSVIVSLVNSYTSPEWLPPNINRGKLNNFYWMLAVLSAINFFIYLCCAWWYKPKEHSPSQSYYVSKSMDSGNNHDSISYLETSRTT